MQADAGAEAVVQSSGHGLEYEDATAPVHVAIIILTSPPSTRNRFAGCETAAILEGLMGSADPTGRVLASAQSSIAFIYTRQIFEFVNLGTLYHDGLEWHQERVPCFRQRGHQGVASVVAGVLLVTLIPALFGRPGSVESDQQQGEAAKANVENSHSMSDPHA